MINVLIGLALSLAVYFGLELGAGLGLVPSVLAALASGTLVYVLLARRSNQQLQARMQAVEAALSDVIEAGAAGGSSVRYEEGEAPAGEKFEVRVVLGEEVASS